jgi:chromosome segregation ATPase
MNFKDIIEDLENLTGREDRVDNRLDLILNQIEGLQCDFHRVRNELIDIRKEKNGLVSRLKDLSYEATLHESTSIESRKRIKSMYFFCVFLVFQL